MRNFFIRFLVLCRNLVGLAQVILVLGGCFSLIGSDMEGLSASVQLFLILLGFQLVILFLIYLLGKSSA
jgi:hypothetical protein